MKLVILHPPPYLNNYPFFEELGKLVDLTIYVFGDRPQEHPSWLLEDNYREGQHSYRIKCLGRGSYPKKQLLFPLFLAELAKDRPDTVLSIAFAPYGFYAAVCKALLGYRFCIQTESTASSDGHIQGLRRKSRSMLLALCNGVISCSPDTGSYLRELQPATPIRQILQTIDVDYFRQQASFWQQKPDELQRLRAKLGIEETAPVLLSIGRFVPLKQWEKGIDLLSLEPKLHYILIGQGELEGLYRSRAEELNVASRLHILPFMKQEELCSYMAISNLFYFPSQRETYGYVLAEALASGLPVLCSDKVGGKILVQQGVNGWVFAEQAQIQAAELHGFLEDAANMRRAAADSMLEHRVCQRAKRFAEALASF